jgi:hypothetical protein
VDQGLSRGLALYLLRAISALALRGMWWDLRKDSRAPVAELLVSALDLLDLSVLAAEVQADAALTQVKAIAEAKDEGTRGGRAVVGVEAAAVEETLSSEDRVPHLPEESLVG